MRRQLLRVRRPGFSCYWASSLHPRACDPTRLALFDIRRARAFAARQHRIDRAVKLSALVGPTDPIDDLRSFLGISPPQIRRTIEQFDRVGETVDVAGGEEVHGAVA